MDYRSGYSKTPDDAQIREKRSRVKDAGNEADRKREAHLKSVVETGERAERLRRQQTVSSNLVLMLLIIAVSLILAAVAGQVLGILVFVAATSLFVYSMITKSQNNSDNAYQARKEFFQKRSDRLSERGKRLKW